MKFLVTFFANLILFLYPLVALSLPGSDLAGRLESSLKWLSQQQNTDGTFGDYDATHMDLIVSHEAIMAFRMSTNNFDIRESELNDWLDQKELWSTSNLALDILIRGDSPVPEMDIPILGNSNRDGGFPAYGSGGSNPYDTALAIYALGSLKRNDIPEIYYAVEYLRSLQEENGGFSLSGNESSEILTSLILRSLNQSNVREISSDLINDSKSYLNEYLADSQGIMEAEAWQVAMVLLSMIPVTTDVTQYQNAITNILDQQLDNGSWGNDVYTTSLISQLMSFLLELDMSPNPQYSTLRGRIVDSLSSQPVSGVKISIGNLESMTDEYGVFEISGIGQAVYDLTISATGYQEKTKVLDLTASNVMDIGSVAISVETSSSVVEGVVTNANSGVPIPGVKIIIGNNAVNTDESGFYRIASSPGELTFNATKDGFSPVSGVVSIYANVVTEFPFQLKDISVENPPESRITGTVFDRATGEGLGEVEIVASDGLGNNSVTTYSGSNGEFNIDYGYSGGVNLEFSLPGYFDTNAATLLVSDASVNFPMILMEKIDGSGVISLSGRVLVDGKEEFLPGASVEVTESGARGPGGAKSYSAIADENGFFSLQDLPFKEMEVLVRANGYLSQFSELSFTDPGSYNVDFRMSEYSAGGIVISDFGVDQEIYGAFDEVIVELTVLNSGSSSRSIFSQIDILDEENESVSSFAMRVSGNTGYSDVINLIPNVSSKLNSTWNTSSQAPGLYTVLTQIFDGQTGQVLSVRRKSIEIVPDASIRYVKGIVDPLFTTVDSVEELSVLYRIGYRSNYDSEIILDHSLSDSNNSVLSSGSSVVNVPTGTGEVQVLTADDNISFSNSGRYLVSFVSNKEVVIAPVWVTVSPADHIDMESSISPGELTPGSDGKVSVEITVKGVEGD